MISQRVNGFERRVMFRPGFHKVHSDPKQNYGVHGMDMAFYLIGEKGVIHFMFQTGMMLDETYEWWESSGHMVQRRKYDHMGIDVGYHSPTPMFDGQEVRWPTKMRRKVPDMPEVGPDATQEERLAYINNIVFDKIGDEPPNCEFLGIPCYCDGSAMRAEGWMKVFLHEGDEKIWEMLEQEYIVTFNRV